jgi:hypothetical protein
LPYTIGYARKGVRGASTAESGTGREALQLVLDLQASDEEIRFIKAPAGFEISGIEELRMLAEQESEVVRWASS